MTFEELCNLLPADVNWGDPITPAIVEEIVGNALKGANHELD